MKELKELAARNNVATSTVTNNVRRGWYNTPKGVLQILWERGYIDSKLVKTARSSRYYILSKKDDYDNVTGKLKDDCKKYSLNHVLSTCKDFMNEKADLESLCDEIITTNNTKKSILYIPKFHCELAGEGIEYIWVAAKRFYRKAPLHEKNRLLTLNYSSNYQ